VHRNEFLYLGVAVMTFKLLQKDYKYVKLQVPIQFPIEFIQLGVRTLHSEIDDRT
jgi:hypothetical protein